MTGFGRRGRYPKSLSDGPAVSVQPHLLFETLVTASVLGISAKSDRTQISWQQKHLAQRKQTGEK